MHNNATTSKETKDEGKPGYRYTNKKEGDGLVFTSRNGGWSAEGMIEYNRLCKLVTDDRRDDRGDFDLHYREHWRSTMKPSKYKKQRRTRENPVVAIYSGAKSTSVPNETTSVLYCPREQVIWNMSAFLGHCPFRVFHLFYHPP